MVQKHSEAFQSHKSGQVDTSMKMPEFRICECNATTTFPQVFGAIPLKKSVQSRWGLPDSKVGEVSLTICPKRNPRTARKTNTDFFSEKQKNFDFRFDSCKLDGGFSMHRKLPWVKKQKHHVSQSERIFIVSLLMPAQQSISQNKSCPKSPGEKLIVVVAPRIFLTGLVPTGRCDYLVGSMKGFFHQK